MQISTIPLASSKPPRTVTPSEKPKESTTRKPLIGNGHSTNHIKPLSHSILGSSMPEIESWPHTTPINPVVVGPSDTPYVGRKGEEDDL